MRIEKIVILLVVIPLFVGCTSAQKIYETNSVLDEMMLQKRFEIQVKFAQPMATRAMNTIASSGLIPPGSSINQMDLNGSGYFLRLKGDSIAANLAYYGERQMGGGYTDTQAIVFKGVAAHMEIVKDEVKQKYTIKFTIQDKTENYLVTATAGRTLNGTISVSSSQRSIIRYVGDVIALKEE